MNGLFAKLSILELRAEAGTCGGSCSSYACFSWGNHAASLAKAAQLVALGTSVIARGSALATAEFRRACPCPPLHGRAVAEPALVVGSASPALGPATRTSSSDGNAVSWHRVAQRLAPLLADSHVLAFCQTLVISIGWAGAVVLARRLSTAKFWGWLSCSMVLLSISCAGRWLVAF